MLEVMNNYWFVLGLFTAFVLGLLTGIRYTRNIIYGKLAKKLPIEDLNKVITPEKH